MEKQKKAIEILKSYGEPIWEDETAIGFDERAWLIADFGYSYYRTEITLDQLE